MRPRRHIALLSFVLGVVACNQETASPPSAGAALGPDRVATVNDAPIPESLFRVYVINAQKDPDQLTPEERTAFIEGLVQMKLLADAAAEQGLLEERRIASELELQRWQLAARAMALRHLEQNPATDAELQALYDENLPRLGGTQYKARHILVESREDALGVIEQLRQGEDFVALATEHADGPTGPNGGDLGWFTPDSTVQPFADAVRTMQVGTYSTEPVQTDFGFHVILLEDTRTQEAPTLDAVRNELTNAVERNKIEAFVKSLSDAAAVAVE
jgi:peptidyl-prolyl cis-trans isomerase C